MLQSAKTPGPTFNAGATPARQFTAPTVVTRGIAVAPNVVPPLAKTFVTPPIGFPTSPPTRIELGLAQTTKQPVTSEAGALKNRTSSFVAAPVAPPPSIRVSTGTTSIPIPIVNASSRSWVSRTSSLQDRTHPYREVPAMLQTTIALSTRSAAPATALALAKTTATVPTPVITSAPTHVAGKHHSMMASSPPMATRVPATVANLNRFFDALRVESNSKYIPRDGKTYCNVFVADTTKKLGTPIRQQLANKMPDWLSRPASGWKQIHSSIEAQEYAGQGNVVVASWKNTAGAHGHIALVRPGFDNKDPTIINVGKSNFTSGDVRAGFGTHVASQQFKYFYHPTPLTSVPAVGVSTGFTPTGQGNRLLSVMPSKSALGPPENFSVHHSGSTIRDFSARLGGSTQPKVTLRNEGVALGTSSPSTKSNTLQSQASPRPSVGVDHSVHISRGTVQGLPPGSATLGSASASGAGLRNQHPRDFTVQASSGTPRGCPPNNANSSPMRAALMRTSVGTRQDVPAMPHSNTSTNHYSGASGQTNASAMTHSSARHNPDMSRTMTPTHSPSFESHRNTNFTPTMHSAPIPTYTPPRIESPRIYTPPPMPPSPPTFPRR